MTSRNKTTWRATGHNLAQSLRVIFLVYAKPKLSNLTKFLRLQNPKTSIKIIIQSHVTPFLRGGSWSTRTKTEANRSEMCATIVHRSVSCANDKCVNDICAQKFDIKTMIKTLFCWVSLKFFVQVYVRLSLFSTQVVCCARFDTKFEDWKFHCGLLSLNFTLDFNDTFSHTMQTRMNNFEEEQLKSRCRQIVHARNFIGKARFRLNVRFVRGESNKSEWGPLYEKNLIKSHLRMFSWGSQIVNLICARLKHVPLQNKRYWTKLCELSVWDCMLALWPI